MNPPRIITFTGRHVNPLDVRSEDIAIEDIAHALACCNRFAGHAKKPISVAQHSVYVSRLCDSDSYYCNGSALLSLQGLLHDGSEAYLGDVTKWLKQTPVFAGYREAEERIQTAIYQHFGVPVEQHDIVSHADKLMLKFEGAKSYGKMWPGWSKLIGYELITPQEEASIGSWGHWTWKQSEELFLERFRSLTHRLRVGSGRS